MVQATDEMEQPDLPQAVNLLKEMNTNIQHVSQLVDNMLDRVKNGEITTDSGLSFLEMKYQMLLSYLINLTYIVLRKCSGERIESDPSIDRLIEIRTVLEKIRPIDSKLKYQIDKLVKTAVVGATSEDDPHLYHANPSNLVSKLDNTEEGSTDISADEEDKEKANKSNIYVPPKLAAVHYDERVSRTDGENKNKERSKKQFLNSSVMRELREEYSEAPLEVSTGNHVKHSISKLEQEKTEYEENYLTRLPVTKAEKNRRKNLTTVGVLADEITGRSTGRNISRKHKIKSKKGKGFKRRRTH
ncbi:neuroguidin isoform X1 [Galleria mellonella]|uniref:Neuroguidin isoform X1 n=2 Tax=Galleria mellonella TaxID=7137 RepID=A0A6J1WQ33_GALME|nr:neuroguidin isoform X1 [Galleria mellonella]